MTSPLRPALERLVEELRGRAKSTMQWSEFLCPSGGDDTIIPLAAQKIADAYIWAADEAEKLLTAHPEAPETLRAGWQPIATAPKVHPLSGGDTFLLAWLAPGINEWIIVVGCWRDGWFHGEHKAYPTHWAPVAPPKAGE
jgi:hypothetical protein